MAESILVIEDDEILREVVEDTLLDAGYQVCLARGPDEAIELARTRRFHLVLADVRMAGSTDGVGAVEQIKKRQPHIRSIIMTGYASQEVPLRAARIQADDYLLKGDRWFGVTELRRVVRRTLDREERRDPGLLARLLSLPGKLARALFEAKLADLEQERKAVLKIFFVLMRPGHLLPRPAAQAWVRLEKTELEFHRLSTPGEIPALRAAYQEVEQFLSQGRDDGGGFGDLPRDRFDDFYQKVREGLVELPQFERAARLRVDPEARLESVEAYALYQWLWSHSTQPKLDGFRGLAVGPYVLHDLVESVARVPRYCAYRATRGDGSKPFLVRVIRADKESPPPAGEEVIEAQGALFFIQNWPWPDAPQGLSFRKLMVPGGMSFRSAWKLLRPVFSYTLEEHGKGLFCGTLSPDDLFQEEDGSLRVLFVARPWLGSERGVLPANLLHHAFQPPELERGRLSAASDQFCLATLLLFFLMGYPDHLNFLMHCRRASASLCPILPETLQLVEGPALKLILQRMRHLDPGARAPGLGEAIAALDNLEAKSAAESPR